MMTLKLRVEYEFKVDEEDYDIEEIEEGAEPRPLAASELCQLVHGCIEGDPRGIQDIIEDNDARRVTLVVTPA